jgi:DNA-directed RNA polymerase subunit M/transcription elongation factor TFIIS
MVEETDITPERQTTLDLIAHACAKHTKLTNLHIKNISSIVRRIERSCYNAAIHTCEKDHKDRTWDDPVFVARYSALCYKVLANLDNNSTVGSNYLGDMISTNDIDPRAVGELSSATLYPEGSVHERNIIAVRREQKVQEKFSEKYKCSKCYARKCVWFGVQTRGLDEPEDKHCRCLECGHQWKENG